MTTAPRLPRQLTSFVGRDAELEQLASQLAIHPLVTLLRAWSSTAHC